jgi:SepF-like predicted cell division protein (DUF552 family)
MRYEDNRGYTIIRGITMEKQANNTIVQQVNEPNFVVELKHMKSGSALILSISKLRVSGDNLDEVMQHLRVALSEFQEASQD